MTAEAFKGGLPDGPVRLTLPASVANDLGSLRKGLASLAERLGHPSCFSGADCYFQLQRDWLINERLEVSAVALPTDPVPWRQAARFSGDPLPARSVTATLPDKVAYDLGSLQEAIGRVVGKLGCPACCSGFDIAFRRELDLLRVDENLDVQGFGRFR